MLTVLAGLQTRLSYVMRGYNDKVALHCERSALVSSFAMKLRETRDGRAQWEGNNMIVTP